LSGTPTALVQERLEVRRDLVDLSLRNIVDGHGCPLRIQLRLEELDRSAGLEGHDIEAELSQPRLDLACVWGVSEHPETTRHRDHGILARTSTRNT
jgi:hypothetical protein